MKIAILGAGNVALANACFLAHSGHDVHLWSAFAAERSAIGDAGGLSAAGAFAGKVNVTVAADVKSCLAGAALVMVAAPAFAHQTLMSSAAPHLIEEQDALVHPVTGLSSLLLSRLLKTRAVKPTIIDLSTSLFTTRKTFITEVVPYALVFYQSLGRVAAIEMPVTGDLVRLTCALYDRDFVAEGHTVERLGLGGLDTRGILNIATDGF
jgi:hypothetical protein